jgi:hypothetical protein
MELIICLSGELGLGILAKNFLDLRTFVSLVKLLTAFFPLKNRACACYKVKLYVKAVAKMQNRQLMSGDLNQDNIGVTHYADIRSLSLANDGHGIKVNGKNCTVNIKLLTAWQISRVRTARQVFI